MKPTWMQCQAFQRLGGSGGRATTAQSDTLLCTSSPFPPPKSDPSARASLVTAVPRNEGAQFVCFAERFASLALAPPLPLLSLPPPANSVGRACLPAKLLLPAVYARSSFVPVLPSFVPVCNTVRSQGLIMWHWLCLSVSRHVTPPGF
jgi:hypothetical protein